MSTDGRNEKRNPCVSAMAPSLGSNETRLVAGIGVGEDAKWSTWPTYHQTTF